MGIFDWWNLRDQDAVDYVSRRMKQEMNSIGKRGKHSDSDVPLNKHSQPESSAWTYTFDGLWYNEETNTYSNDPK